MPRTNLPNYIKAGEALTIAYLQMQRGNRNQAIKALAKAIESEDFGILAEAIDTINERAIAAATRKKSPETAKEKKSGKDDNALVESLASVLEELSEENAVEDDDFDDEDDDLVEAEDIDEEPAPEDPMDKLVARPRRNTSRDARVAANVKQIAGE